MIKYRIGAVAWFVAAIVGAVVDKGAVYVTGAAIASLLFLATADIIAAIERKP